MMLSKKNVSVALAAVFLISFVFLFSFRSNMFDIDIYEKEFDNYDPPVENRLQIAQRLLLFLQGKDADISSFSEKERSHIEDVRRLVRKGNYILIGSLAFFITSLVYIYHLSKKNFLKNLSNILFTAGALAYLKLAASFVLYLSFGSSFSLFHRIFFTGNWQFPSHSLLITLFPQQFFSGMFIKIMVDIFTYTNIIILAGILIRLKTRRIKK